MVLNDFKSERIRIRDKVKLKLVGKIQLLQNGPVLKVHDHYFYILAKKKILLFLLQGSKPMGRTVLVPSN